MKKVALVFVIAVLAPSLALAWLAVRSLRDQQFLLERQQSLLNQQVTDALARNISDYLAQQQQDFSAQVESLAAAGDLRALTAHFDDELRRHWPLAEVGFCVTASGKILSPLPNARPAAEMFRLDNSSFLGNRAPVEVYLTPNNANAGGANENALANNSMNFRRGQANQAALAFKSLTANSGAASPAQPRPDAAASEFSGLSGLQGSLQPNPVSAIRGLPAEGGGRGPERSQPNASPSGPASEQTVALNGQIYTQKLTGNETRQAFTLDDRTDRKLNQDRSNPPESSFSKAAPAQADTDAEPPPSVPLNYKAAQARAVSPQSQVYQMVEKDKTESPDEDAQYNLSKVVPAEAEFRQLVGGQSDGMFARFLQNKLKLMCWHRLLAQPDLIFGAQLNLDRVVEGLRGLLQPARSRDSEICVAVLDDNAKPVMVSRPNFQTNWKRPFVATEVGDALPHWEAAAYLVDPAQLTQAARTAKLTLGLLIGVLLVAIGVGSLLIVRSLGAELKLARQKTDFVSNVSHELKSPLTSIRMFSELLAEGRVADPARQHSYLQIITAEAARLTRLINNVLDFSRMERGEKKYDFQPRDLTGIVREAARAFHPHLESAGFQFACELPEAPVSVRGDADALSQIIVNLLSNAEKYSSQPERRSPGALDSASAADVPGKEIRLLLERKESPLPHAEIRVLDRGPGVPHGCEEKVFEKFYRAHDSLSSGIQGSGLGLTIARQIARAHGGDVVYEARQGGGSCFILRLPVQAA